MKKVMFEKITPFKKHVENMKRDEWIPENLNVVSMELLLMYIHGVVPICHDEHEYDQNKFQHETIKKQIYHRELELECWKQNEYQIDDEFYILAMIELNESQLSILRNLKRLNKTMMS
jgi:hypothetical protein